MKTPSYIPTLALLALLGAAVSFSGCQTPKRAPLFPSGAQGVAAQQLAAHARRLLEATDLLGIPFSLAERRALVAAFQEPDDSKVGQFDWNPLGSRGAKAGQFEATVNCSGRCRLFHNISTREYVQAMQCRGSRQHC